MEICVGKRQYHVHLSGSSKEVQSTKVGDEDNVNVCLAVFNR